MKNRLSVLFAFMAFVLVVSLACSVLGGGTTTQPQVQSPVDQPATQAQAATPQSLNNTSSNSTTTFTDQNNYYEVEIPSNFEHTSSTDKDMYIDTFKTPDGNGMIENIVYDDGTGYAGSLKGKYALLLINTYYSKTGKEGDIRVTDDSIMDDGSERLTWSSRAGGWDGISFFENRKTAFLMFTVVWSDEQYHDPLLEVIKSYKTP